MIRKTLKLFGLSAWLATGARAAEPAVKIERDVFWVVHAKQDPVKFLEKYGNRVELMHVKDMKKGLPAGLLTGKSEATNDVASGTGTMKWPEIMQSCAKGGREMVLPRRRSAGGR